MRLGYEICKGRLGRLEVKFFDLDTPIPKPTAPDLPAFQLLETHTIESTAQGVTMAHRRKAEPIPEKE